MAIAVERFGSSNEKPRMGGVEFHKNYHKGISPEEADSIYAELAAHRHETGQITQPELETLGGVVVLFGATEAEDIDLSDRGEDLEAAA